MFPKLLWQKTSRRRGHDEGAVLPWRNGFCVQLSGSPFSFPNNNKPSHFLCLNVWKHWITMENWLPWCHHQKIMGETLMASKYNLPVLNLFHALRNSCEHYVGRKLWKPVLSSQSLAGVCFINLSSVIDSPVSFVHFWDQNSWLEEALKHQLAWRLFSLIRQKKDDYLAISLPPLITKNLPISWKYFRSKH